MAKSILASNTEHRHLFLLSELFPPGCRDVLPFSNKSMSEVHTPHDQLDYLEEAKVVTRFPEESLRKDHF